MIHTASRGSSDMPRSRACCSNSARRALIETVTVDGLDDALKLLARELPGRDAIRLVLRMAD